MRKAESLEKARWVTAKKCFAGLPPRTPLAAGGRRAAGPQTPELGPSGPKTSQVIGYRQRSHVHTAARVRDLAKKRTMSKTTTTTTTKDYYY